MRTEADDSKRTALRALRRRHALLAAYLEVLDRLDGPSRRRTAELRWEQRPRREIPIYRISRMEALGSGSSMHATKRLRRRGPPIAVFDPLRAQHERAEADWLASTEEQDWFDGESSLGGFTHDDETANEAPAEQPVE